MNDQEFPKLILLDWHEGDEMVISQKGWFCNNRVELANGNLHQVCFFDPWRLTQHLEEDKEEGNPFFIENALIVLSEVTIENMEKAIREAYRRKFFDNLVPIKS